MIYVHFQGRNGYSGCDYEEYQAFEDDMTSQEIDEISNELAYENAETYEYIDRGWDNEWESEEDREFYYENAMSYCGWEYCSQEEFEENS